MGRRTKFGPARPGLLFLSKDPRRASGSSCAVARGAKARGGSTAGSGGSGTRHPRKRVAAGVFSPSAPFEEHRRGGGREQGAGMVQSLWRVVGGVEKGDGLGRGLPLARWNEDMQAPATHAGPGFSIADAREGGAQLRGGAGAGAPGSRRRGASACRSGEGQIPRPARGKRQILPKYRHFDGMKILTASKIAGGVRLRALHEMGPIWLRIWLPSRTRAG